MSPIPLSWFSFANTNPSMYINLKPNYKVNELDNLNFQQREEVSEQLMIILQDIFILYNSSEPKEIICQTSAELLMNKKPIFK